MVEVLDAGVGRMPGVAGYGERVSSSGPLHAPLLINEAVFDARHALHTWLMRTGLRLAEVIGPLSDRSSQGLASYLLRNIDALRRQEWAPGVEAELRGLLKKAIQATQPPGERVSVGNCGAIISDVECTNPLTPLKDQDEIRCKVCGTTWDVKARQRDAIGASWNAVGPPPLIIKALAQYGIHVRMSSFKNWVKLGHLKPVDGEGRKEYRVNEVWAVAKRMKERRKVS
ncbi:hypothetical protein ACFRJ8_14830 [Arthrobacter sp. NPDC056886]|uniref:hypothetical protein n=1 Tax=Arthrobacter sp. NPDC056886 TaxID=3345960 RepID=UPI00366FCF9D